MQLKLCKQSAVKEGKALVKETEDLSFLVCRVKGEIQVLENRCSHDDGPLGEGEISDGQVTCPRHGAKFDVCTGEALCMPANYPVATFPVSIKNDFVFIEVDDD